MLPDLPIRYQMMALISHRLRPSNSPRLLLCCRHRTTPRSTPRAIPPSQSRLYTKSTLDGRRARAVEKGLSIRLNDKAILLPPRRPPPPSPNKPPPPPKAEAFGKPRENSSKVAKAERFKEGRRIEKALRHEHHGENVYAYMHLGTKQVVYSLTRVMEVCFLHANLTWCFISWAARSRICLPGLHADVKSILDRITTSSVNWSSTAKRLSLHPSAAISGPLTSHYTSHLPTPASSPTTTSANYPCNVNYSRPTT